MSAHVHSVAPPQPPFFSREEILAETLSIAENIAAHAIREGPSVTWVTRVYDPTLRTRKLERMNFRLYDGLCGTAIFLAFAGKCFDRADLRQLASDAFDSIAVAIDENPRALFQYGIGAGVGAFSMVYALSIAAGPLSRPELLDSARSLATALTLEDIAADRSLDTLSGAAGCLLGLLRLYSFQPDPSLFDKAVECGEHLLRRRVLSPSGFQAWPIANGKLRTGFAHGAAGISYALLELYCVTQDSKFLEAANEARKFEDSLYSEQFCNWLTAPSMGPSFNRWCNGAVGIGLGSLEAFARLQDENYLPAVRRAIGVTERSTPPLLDYPCCGVSGWMELFLSASRIPEFADARGRAESLAAAVVNRSRVRGGYSLEPDENIYNCSFHQGMAGIGYQFLRLAMPHQVPSLLLWNC